MVFRTYVEKKEGFRNEAKALKEEINDFLMIKSVTDVRIINRYDVEDIDQELFSMCKKTVFSEPQVDDCFDEIDTTGTKSFVVEFLPGQFDQRADSAAQCIQIISMKNKPLVRSAKVYLLSGDVSEGELSAIKKHVINPVEACEASFEKYDTLKIKTEIPQSVKTLDGFLNLNHDELKDFVDKYALAMDEDDIKFCQDYFKTEQRDPTITEIRMIDTYWSDHCRHTTFLTTIDNVEFEDDLLKSAFEDYLSARDEVKRTKPKNLMDVATIAVKLLKKQGLLDKLDESEEINACTVKIDVTVDGKKEPWLLLFKNETHNHPTEIEPFGGAATCIGGAIRDPLSGRSYVYGAMRVTGAADPTRDVKDTIPGKLPQKKIVTTAANGYSSYGNQIGLATGQVDEIYHDGYQAKRLEIGAVIGATPRENVRRECPVEGDIVILLGGRTGRDGCGGATGSSKSHTKKSLETCGAEVQKGNAPEERKLQRLFRNREACMMIKRCNDFGAGGVSVAIGELADGLLIDLNAVPKKYDGLDGTEIAISESQERMAVVVSKEDAKRFIEISNEENLEATIVASVTEKKRLVMTWNGQEIVNVSREFLNSNGAPKHVDILLKKPKEFKKETVGKSFEEKFKNLAGDLNVCSKRGLSERFDSTIGAGTVMMPFGGFYQLTPNQAMVQKISVLKGHTDDCSFMSWGYNPFITEKSPYHGAYLAVIESVCKLIASGAEFEDVYLTFQEYFEHPNKDPERWGKPLSALLGAFEAQKDLKIAAIGGKDSMSGTFENIDVPPTLVSFAVTTGKTDDVITPEFKKAGHKCILLTPKLEKTGLPNIKSLLEIFDTIKMLKKENKVFSAYTLTYGGIAEAIMKMCFGNFIGFKFESAITEETIFSYNYGSFILEVDNSVSCGTLLGQTVLESEILYRNSKIDLYKLLFPYEERLEKVYPCNIEQGSGESDNYPNVNFYPEKKELLRHSKIKVAKPRVLIPVFPGTNCEFDSAKAISDAGGVPEIFVVNNLSAQGIKESTEKFSKLLSEAQIVFIPGGFSGGDEPDGSGKFITAFFRNENIKREVKNLLENRDGLMCGICNGFQALIKLGLVPYGKIIDPDENAPTLTFNTIGRHQSKIVRTRVASNKSPWLMNTEVGEIFSVPISHGEGKFVCSQKVLDEMIENGQIATQYCDEDGNATSNVQFNPNDSCLAIEGITSKDGRIFGKMGHAERVGDGLYKNVPGNFDIGMFKGAIKYFE